MLSCLRCAATDSGSGIAAGLQKQELVKIRVVLIVVAINVNRVKGSYTHFYPVDLLRFMLNAV